MNFLSQDINHIENITKLPIFLKPKSVNDLIRVGRDNDGGYLISKSDVTQSDHIIGLGINDDWSFEEGFTKLKKVRVSAYDASVDSDFFLRQVLVSLKRLKLRSAFRSAQKFSQYKSFFSNGNTHISKFVTDFSLGQYISIDAVFKSAIYFKNIFLKIDIEGFEYRILESIIENSHRITGLVIEFHDCDLHIDRIEQFVSRLPLQLVHVHANNYGLVNANHFPLVLEITFSKHASPDNDNVDTLPHPLDMPNNPEAKEIKIMFY